MTWQMGCQDGRQLAYLGLSWLIYKCLAEPLKSLLLQVGIDDSLIEAGPLTTEDWVLGANGRLSQQRPWSRRLSRMFSYSRVQHHYLADIFLNLIWFLVPNSIAWGFLWLNQPVYWTIVYLSDGLPGHNKCINQRKFWFGRHVET